MNKSRFTDGQIMAILSQHQAGVPMAELGREHNVSAALIYQRRSEFGGVDASKMKRLKELEAENARLKKCKPRSWLNPSCVKKSLRKRCKGTLASEEGTPGDIIACTAFIGRWN